MSFLENYIMYYYIMLLYVSCLSTGTTSCVVIVSHQNKQMKQRQRVIYNNTDQSKLQFST